MTTTYESLLKHPKWLNQRKIILSRDKNKCTKCGGTFQLQIHHKEYHIDKTTGNFVLPWKYENKHLTTLCGPCHKSEHLNNNIPVLTSNNTLTLSAMTTLIKNIFSRNTEDDSHFHQENPTNNYRQDLTPSVIKVDLYDFGFTKAGATGADPAALRTLLHDIHNGFIVDVNDNEEEQRREREKREGEIEKLQQEITVKDSDIRKLREVEIPLLKEQMSVLRSDSSDLALDRAKKLPETFRNSFNLNLYWPVFIMATIFLFGFYVSAFHSAFFKDLAKGINEANADNISELINTVFNIEAFKVFNLHWFAPIVFFVFSIGLHIVFESEKKFRAALVITVLALILTADSLLAYFIEYNSHIIQVLNGLADPEWAFYKSPRFYLVLFLGFFTCLGWSLILHAIKQEYNKEDLDAVIKIKREQLKEKENVLSESIAEKLKTVIDLETNSLLVKTQIEQKMKQLNSLIYNASDLNKRVTTFYSGWLQYITNRTNYQQLLSLNEAVMSDFRSTHLNK